MAITSKFYKHAPGGYDLDFSNYGLHHSSLTPWGQLSLSHTLSHGPSLVNSPAAKVGIVASPSAPVYKDAGLASALDTIRDAAQNNTANPDTLTAAVYANAGVTGVNASNLGAINSALNSGHVNGAAADTTAEVQTIVNAYQAILNSADGTAGNTVHALSMEQYAAIGVTMPTGPALGGGSALSLMNDVVDGLPTTGVDTIPELQALFDAAHHVELAAGGSAADIAALTRADLELLGVTGLSDANLGLVLAAIGRASADLSVATLASLQKIVSGAGEVVHYGGSPMEEIPQVISCGLPGRPEETPQIISCGLPGRPENNALSVAPVVGIDSLAHLLTDYSFSYGAVM